MILKCLFYRCQFKIVLKYFRLGGKSDKNSQLLYFEKCKNSFCMKQILIILEIFFNF